MKMLASISWRNIWRHPARSGVLVGAVIIGIWAGLVISAWTNGVIEQRINKVIQEELTHLQIHHPDFLTEREPELIITSVDEIFSFLQGDPRVQNFTARTIADGMIQSSLTTSGVQISGVLPEREVRTTEFQKNLVEGTYPDADTRNPVLIGKSLSEKLNVVTGNRIVLSFQDIKNELTSGAFTITGLFRTGQSSYDERKVLVHSRDLSNLIAGKPVYHEIAVMLNDAEQSDEMAAELNQRFKNTEAETWIELSPEMRYMTGTGESYMFYIMVVIILALAFGILNTMLMAIFERMRELGMLMAIGMSKSRVFLMIMLESVFITATGAAGGILLGYLSVSYLSEHGLDLTSVGGDTLAQWGYDPLVYPSITPEEYISVSILIILTAILAAVYPAIKALRLKPGELVREKL